MKWPSSSASALRNSARISASVMRGANRPPLGPHQHAACQSVRQALEGGELGAYKPAQSGPAEGGRPSRSDTNVTGVRMKLLGWAIALAAAGLTPAAAQAPTAAAPPAVEAARRRRPRPLPPRRAPTAAAAPEDVAPDARASACPTAARASRTRSPAIGQRGPGLPRRLAAVAVRDHQPVRARAARLRDGPLPPRRQSDAVAHHPQHHCSKSSGPWSRC